MADATHDDERGLPWGWAQAVDKGGRVYFYSVWRRGRDTTWQRPTRPNMPFSLREVAALVALVTGLILSGHRWQLHGVHVTHESDDNIPHVVQSWSFAGGELLSQSFWRRFGRPRGLSLLSETVHHMPQQKDMDTLQQTVLRSAMRRNGYIHLPNLLGDVSSLALIVDDLEREGLPAQFMLLFDEVWEAVHSVDTTLAPLFGLQNIQDFYVFNVRPGAAGWPIHRDRSGGESDGFSATTSLPLYTTVWMALTDASTRTSCIYCIPAHADINYASQGSEDVASVILASSHQHVTALPVLQGGVLAWSHRLLHWGSASPLEAPAARKALAFTMADPEFEPPSIISTGTSAPPFEARMALIAYSLICYHHSQPVPTHIVPVVLDVLKRHEFNHHLTSSAMDAACGGEGFNENLRLAQESAAGL